jgi:hypothetical protein
MEHFPRLKASLDYRHPGSRVKLYFFFFTRIETL